MSEAEMHYVDTQFALHLRLIVRNFTVPKATVVPGSYAVLISASCHNSSGFRGNEWINRIHGV
jgi:hypothetical protein